MIDESDVMLWLVANLDLVAASTRSLPRHHQIAAADMLIALARAVSLTMPTGNSLFAVAL